MNPTCKQCGEREVENARVDYATPVCFKCLSPPDPLPIAATRDYYVTVCSACRRASCWHGERLCEDSRNAGTVEVSASVLRTEQREHPSYFADRRLRKVCGSVRYVV